MSRRRSLLSVVSSRWYPYSYEYLYHNLIPNEVPSFNLWDEEWESGGINSTTGQNETDSTRIRGKNYIKVSPSETYYFKSSTSLRVAYYDISKTYIGETNGWKAPQNSTLTIPNNVYFIRIAITSTTTYNHDICINKSNSQLNGIYAPYNPHLVGKKTKLLEIEGNGEIVNQLVDDSNCQSYSGKGITATYSSSSHTFTLSGTTTDVVDNSLIRQLSFTGGHKYFLWTSLQGMSGSLSSGYQLYGYGTNVGTPYFNANTMFTANASGTLDVYLKAQVGINLSGKSFFVIITDLTQRYGTGREPTSVTDPRIRRIIENGYIDKNDGTYRSSVVDSLVTRGFNIWDEEWLNGYYDESNGGVFVQYNNFVASKNAIKVLPSTNYYIATRTALPRYVLYYDENKNYLNKYVYISGTNGSFTTPSDCVYIQFYVSYGSNTYNHDICINVSSSLNGTYKPHNDFCDLAHFNPIDINGIHDEFKALDNGYVLRKKTNRYTFTGSESWNSFGTGGNQTNALPSGAKAVSISGSVVPNMKSNTELPITSRDVIYAGGSGISCNDVYIYMSYIPNIAGKYIDYELATYQTANIPLRHLGMVDLSTLTWTKSGLYYYATIPSYKTKTTGSSVLAGNVYCENYFEETVQSQTSQNSFSIENNQIWVKISTTPTGYCYFETADITDETGILTYHDRIKLPAPVQVDGALDSHSTFEITDTEYVWTRDVWKYIFAGNETWIWNTDNSFWYVAELLPSNVASVLGNANKLISNGTRGTIVGDLRSLRIYQSQNPQITSSTNMTSLFPSGTTFAYDLATPQITRIPRGRLGVVDLGSLTWEISGNGNYFRAPMPSDMKVQIDMMDAYCNKYITTNNGRGIYDGTIDMALGIKSNYISSNNYMYIRDSSYTNATDFKNAMNCVYLFYETATEVPDFINQAQTEAGGTINATTQTLANVNVGVK